MNNHILIRNALLGSWNVGSEYIRLCGNEKFETPDELSSRFNINPRRIVDTLMWQCANGKSSEGLYEAFEIWSKFVPAQPSKTN